MLFVNQRHASVGNVATLSVQSEVCNLPDPLTQPQHDFPTRVARPMNTWFVSTFSFAASTLTNVENCRPVIRILYRTAKARELKDLDPTSRATQGEISKVSNGSTSSSSFRSLTLLVSQKISELWRNESPLVRESFEKLAKQEREEHGIKHPCKCTSSCLSSTSFPRLSHIGLVVVYKLQLKPRASRLRPKPSPIAPSSSEANKCVASTSFHHTTPLSEIPALDTSFLHHKISSDWPENDDLSSASLYRTVSAQSCASLPNHLSWEYYSSEATTSGSAQWTPPRSWDTLLIPTRSSDTCYYY